MSLVRQSGQSLAWQVAGFVAMAISGMVTARYLGPADRGLLAAAYLYPQLATSLGSLSLDTAVFHRLSRREFGREEFAGTLWAASGGLGAVVLGLVLAILLAGGERLHQGIPWPVVLVALAPLPWVFGLMFFSALLRGVMDIHWYNVVNHGAKLLSLVTVLALLGLGRLRVWDLVVLGAMVTLLQGLVPIWRMRRHAPGAWRVRHPLLRQLLEDGLRVHAGSVAILLAGRTNLLLANYYLPKAEVGYLYVAITLAELVWFISIGVETVLYPQLAHMTEADAQLLTARVCRQILLLSAMAGLCLAFFAPIAVLVYGGRAFLPAVTPLRLILPGVVALTVSKILSALWVRRGWLSMLTLVAGGTGALSVALNVLLIPRWGTAGAALATALPFVCNAAVSVLLYRRWISNDLGSLLRVRSDDIRHLMRSLWGRSIGGASPSLAGEGRP